MSVAALQMQIGTLQYNSLFFFLQHILANFSQNEPLTWATAFDAKPDKQKALTLYRREMSLVDISQSSWAAPRI